MDTSGIKSIILANKTAYSLYNLSHWDYLYHMNEVSQPYRLDLLAKIKEMMSAPLRKKEAGDLYELAKKAESKDPLERGLIRRFLSLYRQCAGLPEEFAHKLSVHSENAHSIWRQAKRANDFQEFQPALEKMFDLKVQEAAFLDPNVHPQEALMWQHDDSVLPIAQIDRLIRQLRDGLLILLPKIMKRPGSRENINDIDAFFTDSESRTIVPEILAKMDTGLAKKIAEDIHPQAFGIGPKESRIAVSYDYGFISALYGGIHELGHACYQTHSADEVAELGLWGGLSGGFHEGQALFFEQMIGRDPKTIEWIYHEICGYKKDFAAKMPLEVFEAALNKVEPSLIRVSADEVTYCLHVIIRYEIERELFDGSLAVSRVREAWNEKYRQYLGVEVENDSDGVLQDMHWSVGGFGYFQSYALGMIVAAQLQAAMLKELPAAYSKADKGDFHEIYGWLKENVWRHGMVYTVNEILNMCMGEDINAQYLLDYLEAKYI